MANWSDEALKWLKEQHAHMSEQLEDYRSRGLKSSRIEAGKVIDETPEVIVDLKRRMATLADLIEGYKK